MVANLEIYYIICIKYTILLVCQNYAMYFLPEKDFHGSLGLSMSD